MAVRIRPATPDDAGALARLRYQFRAALGTATETKSAFVERCRAWMHLHLQAESPTWRAWVSLADEAIVGNVWVQVIEKVPNPVSEPEAHAYVTNLFVQPAFRGSGVGAQLFSTALAWCRDHDVHAVILWPTRRSRTLYARHGFVAPDDILALNLAPTRLDGRP